MRKPAPTIRKRGATRDKKREKEPAEKPVTLSPLSFEEAIIGLAKAKPKKD